MLSASSRSRWLSLTGTAAAPTSVLLRLVGGGDRLLLRLAPLLKRYQRAVDNSVEECVRVVEVGERLIWNGDVEEVAQRPPTVLGRPDEQAIGGHLALDLFVVAVDRGAHPVQIER